MALKIIDKKKCEKNREKFDMEIEILKKIKHANVISFISKFDTNDFIYIVLELCQASLSCSICIPCLSKLALNYLLQVVIKSYIQSLLN